MNLFKRVCTVLITISVIGFLGSCAEKPGDPSTTGLKQFIGDGFLFKYPSGAQIDLKGKNEWANRTLTITGALVHFEQDNVSFEMPSFEIIVEFFSNPDGLSARDFAFNLIMEGYSKDVADENPTGYWPLNEDDTDIVGFSRRVRGELAWESAFTSGDHEMVRTFVVNDTTAVSIGYRSYPIQNNPIQPAWDTIYLLTLDTLRLEKN
jgi:hypothetical protein